MISLYQRNSGVANSLPYMAPNVCGQLGVILLALRAGTLPSSITDTNNNAWILATQTVTNVGVFAFYVCLSLVAGANVVTINGTAVISNFILTEFTPPAGVQSINGPENVGFDFVTISSYLSPAGQHVLLAGSFANSGNPSWSVSAGSIVDQTHDGSNNNSSVLAMLSSSNTLNTITFTATPTQSSAFILGLVLNG